MSNSPEQPNVEAPRRKPRFSLDYWPIRRPIRNYNVDKAKRDLKAGINVALLAFPQGMAYAAIAGLDIQYGVYGSAVAMILGPLLAGSRFILLGPTNATSVLLFASFLSLGVVQGSKEALLPLVIAMSGIFLVLGAILRVANLIQYISRSVATGYITAAALYIILNQLRAAAGIDFEIHQGATFLTVAKLTIVNLSQTHLPTVILSVLTAVVFVLLNRRFKMLPNVAITLLLMSFVALGMNHLLDGANSGLSFLQGKIELLDAIDARSWPLTVPDFRQLEWVSHLASVSLVIAFLSILEGSSIGKSLAARSGEKLDTNQEMLGMGVANIGCAFLGGMPASGSLTRSQLNWNSGGATRFSSIYAGLLCLFGAFLLGPYTQYIPKSALGVLVIFIGMSLINKHVIRVVLNATFSDAVVFVTTFIAALLIRLDFAIILGAGTSILLFLRKAAVPELVEYKADEDGHLTPIQDAKERSHPRISIVHVEGDLFFGASELFRDQMRQVVEDPDLKVIVLKMRNAYHLDATSVLALEELIRYLKDTNRQLIVSEVRGEALRIFSKSRLIEILGEENLFLDEPQNPLLSTAKALKKAKSLLGDQSAEVKIYVDKHERKNRP